MRIACLSTSLLPGTTANAMQLMKVCESLARNGHQVRLWVPHFGTDLPWELLASRYGLSQQFEVTTLPIWRPARRYDYAIKALAAARRWRADLYYCWPLPAAGLASALGWPTALELHDRPSGLTGGTWLNLFLSGKGARRMLVTTEALLKWLAQAHPSPRLGRLAQIAPNGVDLDQYRNLPTPEQARAAMELPDRFTAAYTGHLYPGRGIGMILSLAERHPEISFVIAGGTDADVAHWQDRVDSLGVTNVRLLGFLPQSKLPGVQAAADVLLMPYQRSITISGGGDSAPYANPMKAAEYLASGRAILSSDLPVLHEILSSEVCLLLPPDDVDAWSEALAHLQADPGERNRLGSAAKASAETRGWDTRAAKAVGDLL